MRQIISDFESARDFVDYINEDQPTYQITEEGKDKVVKTDDYEIIVPKRFQYILKRLKKPSDYDNKLIYGKDTTENIVAIESTENGLEVYFSDGTMELRQTQYWILANKKVDKHFKPLDGNLHYNYIRLFDNYIDKKKSYYGYKARGRDVYSIHNEIEQAMIFDGLTMFKGMKVEDLAVLAFDIEAAGLERNEDSEVFVITNTFKKNGVVTHKQFRVDDYESDIEMIEEWCNWVVEVDPVVITGHNIYGYDLPYVQHCYSNRQGLKRSLPIGKWGNEMRVAPRDSEFRVDGNQTWTYNRARIYGRHIIDGMFLAVKYDIGRNYPSWGLKPIAEFEGLVAPDRQFYDASKIAENWSDPVEREKIVQYCVDDSNDSMALFELMIPSIFYMTQTVPKTFQLMGTSASGAQLNGVMMRAYLQDLHSIPMASEGEYVAGGMSYGIPGVYTNVAKFDAKSFYPSTILAFDIYDPDKDPNAYYLEMVRHFTNKRFEQKDLYKDTGEKYYNDLQAASKVFINSSYGLFGTRGLNFNCFEKAALITKCCRKSLQKAIVWATGRDTEYWWSDYKDKETASQDFPDYSFIDKKAEINFEDMTNRDFTLCNIDTDALSFAKEDGSAFTKEELNDVQAGLNKIMYCEWEDDGYYEKFLIAKAKNYVTIENGKKSVKGSSLINPQKEKALQEMLSILIEDLMDNEGKDCVDIYNKYIKESNTISDITRWTTKRSVSKAVLAPTRTNEKKILDAIKHKNPRQGDKFMLYTAVDGEKQAVAKGEPVFSKKGDPKMVKNSVLRLEEDWSGNEDKEHYTKRVYSTMEILKNVVDMSTIIKYHNKGNKQKLEELLDEQISQKTIHRKC